MGALKRIDRRLLPHSLHVAGARGNTHAAELQAMLREVASASEAAELQAELQKVDSIPHYLALMQYVSLVT